MTWLRLSFAVAVIANLSAFAGACVHGQPRGAAPVVAPRPAAVSGSAANYLHELEWLRDEGIALEALRCTSRVRWEAGLDRYAEQIVAQIAELWKASPEPKARAAAVERALGYLVRSYYDAAQPQNFGAVRLRGHWYHDKQGRKHALLVFRSAITTTNAGANPCFESLIEEGKVQHVINLYRGTVPLQDVIVEEKRLAARLGVSYCDTATQPAFSYRPLIVREQDYARNRPQAMENLARLIREQVLRPNGGEPKGNIYVHCAGGMHRSGMLIGVLQRCINHAPLELIEAEYKRHVDYASAQQPGGYEPLNIRFIRDFDCQLLEPAASGNLR